MTTAYFKHLRKICGKLLDNIIVRDGYQCKMCKAFGSKHRTYSSKFDANLYMIGNSQTRFLTVDHIIPLCEGGTNDLENLQTLCNKCNTTKEFTTVRRTKDLISYKDHPNGIQFHLEEYRCCVCRFQASPVGYRSYRKNKKTKQKEIDWQGFIINNDFKHSLTIFNKNVWCNKCCKRFGNKQFPTYIMLDQQGFFS